MSAVPNDRQEEGLFIVLREYTHTDRKKLYKVLSRPMSDEATAVLWMEFMVEDEPSPGNKFMVVKVVAEVMGDKPPRKKKD